MTATPAARSQDMASAPNSRMTAFDAARAHSRRVRLLKFVVPAIAALGLAGAIGYSLLRPSITIGDAELRVEKGVSVGDGKITMKLPHLTGFNKRQQAYDVKAATATQLVTNPALVDLHDLKAVISMADKSSATLAAATGKFDSTSEILKLRDGVTVSSTKGYAADLKSATIEFKAGTVRSDEPVTVNIGNGIIQGGAMDIQSGGNVITLKNGVRSRFMRATAGTSARPAADTTQ